MSSQSPRTRPDSDSESSNKKQKLTHRPRPSQEATISSRPLPTVPTLPSSVDFDYIDMTDGKNTARSLRVLEIMNDFRTLQVHITSLVTRPEATPADESQYYLGGYAVLRRCNAEAQAILATQYNPGSLGIDGGNVPNTEIQKATLQRIILDAATRRFSAHKIYLCAAAGIRWVQLRKQLAERNLPRDKLQQGVQAIEARLQQELSAITDESVVSDLRTADVRKGYWVDEDPSLERMLAWIRRQT